MSDEASSGFEDPDVRWCDDIIMTEMWPRSFDSYDLRTRGSLRVVVEWRRFRFLSPSQTGGGGQR